MGADAPHRRLNLRRRALVTRAVHVNTAPVYGMDTEMKELEQTVRERAGRRAICKCWFWQESRRGKKALVQDTIGLGCDALSQDGRDGRGG